MSFCFTPQSYSASTSLWQQGAPETKSLYLSLFSSQDQILVFFFTDGQILTTNLQFCCWLKRKTSTHRRKSNSNWTDVNKKIANSSVVVDRCPPKMVTLDQSLGLKMILGAGTKNPLLASGGYSVQRRKDFSKSMLRWHVDDAGKSKSNSSRKGEPRSRAGAKRFVRICACCALEFPPTQSISNVW